MNEGTQELQPTSPRTEFMKSLEPKIRSSRKIVVAAHRVPDYDAACATLFMKAVCERYYNVKDVQIVIEGEPLDTWKDLGQITFTGEGRSLLDYCSNDALLILLDGSVPDRFTEKSENQKALAERKNTVIIDHHEDPVKEKMPIALSHVEKETTSTCEILQHLFGSTRIDKDTARLLIYGIIKDSKKFQNIEKGTPSLLEKSELTREQIEKRLALKPEEARVVSVLNDKKEVVEDRPVKVVSSVLPDPVAKAERGTVGMAYDAFLTSTLTKDDAEVAYVLFPNDDDKTYHLSLRSKGKVDVKQIAQTFAGGGHRYSAGADFLPPPDQMKKIQNSLKGKSLSKPQVVNQLVRQQVLAAVNAVPTAV